MKSRSMRWLKKIFWEIFKNIFQVFLFIGLVVGASLYAANELRKSLPQAQDLRSCFKTKMYHLDFCPGSSSYLTLGKISSYLPAAIVSSEDGNFYNHRGFAWDSLKEAARQAIETGVMKRGGSTISQQLAKNLFLTSEKTYLRKLKEALITIEIERTLSKNEILESYLNVVEFGREIYGVKSAAKIYFDKDPKDLDVVESVFLAMVLPNPKKYSRSFYAKQLTPYARTRMSQLIEDLYRQKRISDFDYLSALHRMETFLTVEDVEADPDQSDIPPLDIEVPQPE